VGHVSGGSKRATRRGEQQLPHVYVGRSSSRGACDGSHIPRAALEGFAHAYGHFCAPTGRPPLLLHGAPTAAAGCWVSAIYERHISFSGSTVASLVQPYPIEIKHRVEPSFACTPACACPSGLRSQPHTCTPEIRYQSRETASCSRTTTTSEDVPSDLRISIEGKASCSSSRTTSTSGMQGGGASEDVPSDLCCCAQVHCDCVEIQMHRCVHRMQPVDVIDSVAAPLLPRYTPDPCTPRVSPAKPSPPRGDDNEPPLPDAHPTEMVQGSHQQGASSWRWAAMHQICMQLCMQPPHVAHSRGVPSTVDSLD